MTIYTNNLPSDMDDPAPDQIRVLTEAVHKLSMQLGRIHEAAEQHRIEKRSVRSWQLLYRECTKQVEL